jgi:anaerobic magnesium-protoporphyrin IX monomethyl ester cyclase
MSQRKRIIFVNPPLTGFSRYGSLGYSGGYQPPLGLCYLAGVARKAGLETRIIDAQACNLDLGQTVSLVKSFTPDYVGITAASMAISAASDLAGFIKSGNPRLKTIIGGCHISALPEATLNGYDNFDFGIAGEGEETLKELLLSLENGRGVKDIKGLVSKDGGGVYFSGPRQRIKDLDSLPMPAFDLLPDIRRFYRLPVQSIYGRYGFSLVTSRGCHGSCSFCDKKVFGAYVAMHGAEYIAEMIAVLAREYGINNILFEDDNFMASKERLEELSGLLKKDRNRLHWTAMARIDGVDNESLELAKSCGCRQISYGVESGSQRILDFYKKGISKDKIKDIIELTKKTGLGVKCFFMWGNPTEDEASLRETFDFIKGLDADDISITFFTPYPGSEIWRSIENYGALDRTWKKMSCFEAVFLPRGLDKKQLIDSRKKALRSFYFRPRIFISYLSRLRSFAQLKELVLSFSGFLNYVFRKDLDV